MSDVNTGALGLIIDIQTAIGQSLPIHIRRDGQQHTIVDTTTRHYAGHGLRRGSKALDEARKDLKEKDKKLRRDIYLYNFKGIEKHGLAWNHMNASQRREWFKRLVMSDQRIPPEALKWAQERGLI